jgi:uncharacterized protein YndB with AHSA1/START domain
MWKWILGVVLVIVIALAGTCFAGYQKLTAGSDTLAVTIRGSRDRVFRLLTTPDSMVTWMNPASTVTPLGKGELKLGDTLRVSTPIGSGNPPRRQTRLWVVRELVAPTTFVLDGIQFDPSGTPHVVSTRRDSLVVVGDSTSVLSTFTMPSTFNGIQTDSSGGGATGKMMAMTQKMLLGTVKMYVQTQLKELKAYVEKS